VYASHGAFCFFVGRTLNGIPVHVSVAKSMLCAVLRSLVQVRLSAARSVRGR
jgi:hypothetical protein